jgi:hypothetical protein
MQGTTSYPRWKLVLIIVFGIVGLVFLAAVGFFVFMKIKSRGGGYTQE